MVGSCQPFSKDGGCPRPPKIIVGATVKSEKREKRHTCTWGEGAQSRALSAGVPCLA